MAKILIQHNRDGLHHVDGNTLMPGLNEVEESDLAGWAKLPAFKALLDDGTIEPVTTKAGKSVAAADLGKLPERTALEMIEKTVTAELLNGWLETETREKVVAALEAQLAAIAPPPVIPEA